MPTASPHTNADADADVVLPQRQPTWVAPPTDAWAEPRTPRSGGSAGAAACAPLSAVRASLTSPHLPTHARSGGACTNPAPPPSQAAADARTPTRATAASSPQTMPRYDILKACLIASLMASLMASNDR